MENGGTANTTLLPLTANNMRKIFSKRVREVFNHETSLAVKLIIHI